MTPEIPAELWMLWVDDEDYENPITEEKGGFWTIPYIADQDEPVLILASEKAAKESAEYTNDCVLPVGFPCRPVRVK